MGNWSRASKSHVAHMTKGDFYASEVSYTLPANNSVTIEHVARDGTVTVLKQKVPLLAGEIIDASFMSVRELRDYYERETVSALKDSMLLSLHLKATMMKISDPIMFGHAVTVYFKDVFEKNAQTFKELGVNADNGLNDLLEKIKLLPEVTKMAIEHDIEAAANDIRDKVSSAVSSLPIEATAPEVQKINSDDEVIV